MLEDEGDVVPVLHEESVGVVDDDYFDGGEEVVVSLLGTVKVEVSFGLYRGCGGDPGGDLLGLVHDGT